LYRLAPGVLDALKIVRPETVIRWHSCRLPSVLALEIKTAEWPSKDPAGIRQLIRKMSLANPLWGAHGFMASFLKLGIDVGTNHRCKVYGEGKATAVPRVEDIPS